MLTQTEIQQEPRPKPKSRIGRARFLLEFFIAAILMKAGEREFGVVPTLLLGMGLFLAIWASLRRLRDIKRSGWWVMVLIVPIALLSIFGFAVGYFRLDVTNYPYLPIVGAAFVIAYLLYLGILISWPSAFAKDTETAVTVEEKQPTTDIEGRVKKTATGVAKRILITAVVLVVGGALVALGMFGYKQWEQRPQVVTSLKGIAIGDKLSDAVFKHGLFEKQEKAVNAVRKYQDEEIYRQKDRLGRLATAFIVRAAQRVEA